MMRQADAFMRDSWGSVSALSRRAMRSTHRSIRVLCWWLCQPLRWLVTIAVIAGLVCWIAALAVWFVLLDLMHETSGRTDSR